MQSRALGSQTPEEAVYPGNRALWPPQHALPTRHHCLARLGNTGRVGKVTRCDCC